MSFLSFSGLKKAYNSLGEEITRTFDSSQTEGGQATEVGSSSSPAPPQDAADTPDGEECAARGEEERGDEDWGQWEEQSKGRATVVHTKTTTPLTSNEGKEVEPAQSPPTSIPATAPTPLSTSTPTPLSTSTPAKSSGGKLDSLPRAELVKYIKRQAQLLQKSKARCDDLTKECEQFRSSQTTHHQSLPDREAIMEELQVVRSERDMAVAEQKTLQQTITSLEQDKQGLDGQLVTLRGAVKKLQSEEEDWKCRVEVASTQLAAQQQHHLQEKEQLESRLAAVCQELMDARTREEGREREGEELQAKFEALKTRLEAAERERDTREEEVEAVREEMDRARRETETVREEVKMSREEVERERKETEKGRLEKARLEEELGHVREQVREASGISEEEQGEIKSLESQLESLQKQLASVCEEREKLQSALKVSQTGLETAQREGTREVERVKMEMAQLQRQLEALQKEKADLQSDQDSLQQERDSAMADRNDIHRKRDELQTANESLQIEYTSLQRETETLLSEKERVLQEKAELEAQVKSLTELVEQQASEATAVDDSAVHSRVKELEQEIESLESRLSRASIENEALQKSSDTAKAEQQEASGELESLQNKLQEREDEIVSLKSELQKGNCKLEELEKECLSLRVRQEEEVGERGREVQQLREKVSDLQQRQLESEKKMEAVRAEAEEAIKREQETSQQTLNQQATAHRDETKKLKAFIVKMKKELAEVRGKGAVGEEDLKRQLEEVRAAAEAGQQRIAESESIRAQAEEALKRMREEVSGLQSERDGLQSSLAAATEETSTLRSELSAAQSDLVTLQTQTDSVQHSAEVAEKEAASLREELATERESHSATKQKLTAAVKEAKTSSVMNLELADYQRSLQALEERLKTAQVELEQEKEGGRKQLEKTDSLRKEIDLQTQQCIAAEDRLSKTKALWMKTKKELDNSRKAEGELQAAIVSLNAQLEGEKQLAEQGKAEMSALTAKLQSMQQQSDSSVGVLQKTVRSLEHKLAAAQNELTTSQIALSQCQQDYNNYKVRVHSVLKQKSSGPSPAEISSEIRQKYETEIIQLRAELQENKSQLSSTLAEVEELSEENHQLTTRHQQLLQDTQQELNTAKKQLEEVESQHSNESREQMEVIGQLRQEVKEVTEAFRAQLHSLREEHQKVVDSLQDDLQVSRNTVTRLQQEADVKVLARAANPPDHSPNHTQSHDPKIPQSVPSEQRGSGEGMDQSELDSNPSFPPTPLSREDSHLSFERLLSRANSEAPSNSISLGKSRSSNINGGMSEAQLRKELAKAMKTIRGLNELLRDSEEATVRLGEQAKLLKEEIRRLERNKEREEGVSNMEYLKNVVLKFLHSENADEQTALVPVITQLLKLSPQEMKFLQDTVQGTPSALPDAGSSLPSPSTHKGLAGYIHRWTGY